MRKSEGRFFYKILHKSIIHQNFTLEKFKQFYEEVWVWKRTFKSEE